MQKSGVKIASLFIYYAMYVYAKTAFIIWYNNGKIA